VNWDYTVLDFGAPRKKGSGGHFRIEPSEGSETSGQ
jgi:hypothetical protein